MLSYRYYLCLTIGLDSSSSKLFNSNLYIQEFQKQFTSFHRSGEAQERLYRID